MKPHLPKAGNDKRGDRAGAERIGWPLAFPDLAPRGIAPEGSATGPTPGQATGQASGDAPSNASDHTAMRPTGSNRIAAFARFLMSFLLINTGRLDERSLGYAVAAGLGYFALASACLALWQVDAILATIWLPNAYAVATLLLARLRNEIPFYAAITIASFAAHLSMGNPEETAPLIALIFTLGHMVDVTLVTWLTRRSSSDLPEISGLTRLGGFLQYGGLVGPLSLCAIAAFALGADWNALATWMLADSMAMILVVPAILLLAQALRQRPRALRGEVVERSLLMVGGVLAVFFVFRQDLYPLLFLVPPVTLLIAFRVGALGTALYVPAIALVAAWMTYLGIGPIARGVPDPLVQTHLLQAFIAANFLTGLPIASILAGRAQMTSELTRHRSELALLTESITDAVLWIDQDRKCTYASPSVERVLGLKPEDMVGHAITERTHEDAHERIVAVLDRLLDGASEQERLTYRRMVDDDQGSAVFIEADCAVVLDPATGARSGVVLSARDVTARVELELQLTRARSTAENAAHAKSEFLANMSHEIRTPMNGVLGFAELMLQGDLDEEARNQTEMIVQSGRSMMLLLNDILDLSKIEAGQIVIDSEPVDLVSTIAECAALHRASAEQQGLSLNFEPELATGPGGKVERPWVLTDGLRLRQIILNLVGNAVKFTERGGVDIMFEQTPREFSVIVQDTGIGISPRRLETIFAPFTQAESDTARRFGGTGLGLTISRQLAELLGGTITVTSVEGEGSTFRLTVPAQYVEPAASESAPPVFSEPPELPQAARVLLVEDHDVNRLLGVEMLERCGQSVAIAHDGNEAIAMVIDSMMRGTPYDLVLMDIQMPGCDGYAATRAIREDGIGPNQLPIIALTANAFPEDIAAAREAGMQAHLAKPLVFADLARALQRWLPTRIIAHDDKDVPARRAVDKEGPLRETKAPCGKETGDHADGADAGVHETTIIDTSRPANSDRRMRERRGEDKQAEGESKGRRKGKAGKPGPDTPHIPPQRHSAAMINRWTRRRGEAIEAVRDALANGSLTDDAAAAESYEKLARLVHKLAGTAAIFGEPELGDQAAELERALKLRLSAEVREALAFELLSVADDPTDVARVAGA